MESNCCPGCKSVFPTPHTFIQHLNTVGATCVPVLQDLFKIPTPPAFIRGAGETDISGQFHHNSAVLYGRGETLLDRLRKDEHERRRKHQIYYPFADEGEWSLAKFLASNLTKTQVAENLKLPWVCILRLRCFDSHSTVQFKTRPRPSFENMDRMYSWLAALPQGAQWQSTKIEIQGFELVQDACLIWRDGLDVVVDLFSNPIFAKYMTYDPHIVMRGAEREYSEFFTGTRAHAIQVSSRDIVDVTLLK